MVDTGFARNIIIAVSLFCSFGSTICFSQTGIMTFNIRYDTPNDGENWWDYRKNEVVELLKNYKADFIGLQEAMPHQRDFIADNLINYDHIGHGRDGKNTDSEGVPLFYNTSAYKLLKSEVFWLSETPGKISRGWDATLNRIVVYGVFESKTTGDILYIFNCHFDHMGEIAREKSAELILQMIDEKKLNMEKVIVMGDFNALPAEEPIEILKRQLDDSFDSDDYPVDGPVGTFSGFNTEMELKDRIDYIFTRNIRVISYKSIDDKRKNGLYPSDHLPILIKI